ncbi:transcription factor UPBEAT1 [Cinnamomum micranthum f. kanehirae]|uniref:Transcription factor UPBEAT1 n=1 Tax=Cinnamomum micranthum f. kanehirae TaxID=337451 RepID=A0A443PUA9_9MAGN|nr:transcription factor UPBEAT1 [Cinnamomum micranthum f. kanehirae]
MGVSQPTILSSLDLKGMVLDNKGMDGCSSGSIWYKVVQLQAMRRRSNRRHRTKRNYGWNRRSNALMKRRALIKGSRRSMGGVERRVRTLQKLLPNVKSMDMDGLFMEAADYILCLEMRVKVMQIMVKVLSNSNA